MYSTAVSRMIVFIFVLLVSIPALVFAQATVNLTLDDGSMDEEFLGTGGITVTRDGSTVAAINVFVELGGSAIYNHDFTYENLNGYSHPTWHVTIPAGQSSASVTLTPLKDNFNEGVETLVFTLLASKPNNGDYIIGAQTTAEMTLADDVATVILTLDDGSMDEELLGTGRFTVTRDEHGNKDQAMNVFVNLGGSAVYNSDFTYENLNGYAHPTWHVTIPAGQNSTSVTLTPLKDNFNEGEETLMFDLLASKHNNGDYIMGAQTTADMTLADDVATVILTLDDGSMDEELLGTGRFTVTRDEHGNKDQAMNVFVNLGGSAVYNSDFTYENLNGYAHPTWHVTIPAGQNSTSVTLTPLKDNFNEGEETLMFDLLASKSNNGDYIIGAQTTADMTLADDVAIVILTLGDGTMDEAKQDTADFAVTRDDHGNKGQAMNVFVNLGGSAVYNSDFTYENLNGYAHPTWHVTIPAGQNSTNVTLTAIKDSVIEGDETLIFTLLASKPNNGDYIIGTQTTAEIAIIDLVDRVFSDSFEE